MIEYLSDIDNIDLEVVLNCCVENKIINAAERGDLTKLNQKTINAKMFSSIINCIETSKIESELNFDESPPDTEIKYLLLHKNSGINEFSKCIVIKGLNGFLNKNGGGKKSRRVKKTAKKAKKNKKTAKKAKKNKKSAKKAKKTKKYL